MVSCLGLQGYTEEIPAGHIIGDDGDSILVHARGFPYNADGDEWRTWTACWRTKLKIPVNAKTLKSEHPRWQPRLVPNNSSPGQDPNVGSVGWDIKRVLTPEKWHSLRVIANDNGQIKAQMHHLAVRASRGNPLIPLNAGTGGSVSHLCDSLGCVRPEHLEVSQMHVSNLARQRCCGVQILVYADVLLMATRCPHDDRQYTQAQNNLPSSTSKSCRKLNVILLGDREAVQISSRFQSIVAQAQADYDSH